ncbi:MAG: LLM class flavin-dependent oxidoreductase [Acetobacteraceae bacterium]|nr:LLM class flavin-dependent oxidoreductase [Acetobacteraceae bacterium]
MSPAREIRLNAFDMACVGHIQHGMWTHPSDQSSGYTSLDRWVSLARLLERGMFDGLFLADIIGVYDVFGGTPAAALRSAAQIPLIDPLALVPAMAHATTHLSFGVTCNLAYEPPYLFARRMATLDHLTQGRIGWNIVTGALDSAARAMGFAQQMAHDDRYDFAEEFMRVVYALWEGGWKDDAVVRDRAGGVYTDPAKVRAIHHAGKQFRLDAVPLWEPSPQRTPVLYQAGASTRGRIFAARHAECVFVYGGNLPETTRLTADLRRRAGTRPLRIFPLASVVTGRTESEARDRLDEYRHHASMEGVLAHGSASLGVDLDRFGMDEPVDASASQAIQSNIEALAAALGPGWTKRNFIDNAILGGRQAPIVGSPSQVADTMQRWMAEADVDGFNLSRTVMPECLADFIELIVPVLQDRGVYKTAYRPGTYRQKLFGAGDRLPDGHPAAAERWVDRASGQ